MMHKQFYQVGSRMRNPSLGKWYAFLKESENWTRDQLVSHQLDRLRELLSWANEHSPYYRKTFAAAGFDPRNVNSLDALRACPAIAKSELLEHNAEIHATKGCGKFFTAETSGSTGQALVFRRDESWDSFHRASVRRGLSWYGVNPWDKNGYFWGYNIDSKAVRKTRALDYLQNRFRVFSYDRAELISFVRKLKGAAFIGGYSSMIYEVARIINEGGFDTDGLKLKLVKGTSEKIFPHYHDASQQAFGRKVSSEYGAAESGIIAFECAAGNMHLQTEGVVVEEEDGEILVTNLHSRSFPIIRYRLGDFIELAPESETCPCGMKHPLLRSVTGRVGKRVFGKERTYPSLTFYYVAKNLFFDHGVGLNYQFVQNEKGKLRLRIEGEVGQQLETLIDSEMKKYFEDDIDYVIEPGEQIHSRDKKARDFVSTLE